MKKIVITLALVVLIIPISAQAFSFSGIWGKMFGPKEVKQEDFEYEELDQELAQDKYDAWVKAYDENNIYELTLTKYNLLFSNAEVNYILKKRLEDLKDPPVDDFEIWFKDGGYIYAKAHLLKYLPGNVSGEIEFIEKNDETIPHVRKIKWGKLPIPSFVANIIIKRELGELIDFLHSDPDIPYVEVGIEEDFCEIEFKREK